MRTNAIVAMVLCVCGCNLLHRNAASDGGTATADPTGIDTTSGATTAAATTAAAAATAPAATAADPGAAVAGGAGDEAGARKLLMKFLAPGADGMALTKPLRPAKADYASLFDAATAAKLQPQYDAHWDKEPMAIAAKAGQTELKLWAATSEELQAGKGNAGEFPGGWKRVAPHLTPHQTWYRFKFVKPGEDLGMAFDGLTFVNGHWVVVPKPWHGL